MQRFHSLIISIGLSSVLWAAEPKVFSVLESIDVDHPFCKTKLNLRVGKEQFFEIGNEIAGVKTYNSLVKFYQEENWASFDERYATFRKVFEKSPLQEAVSFLKFQADTERIPRRIELAVVKQIEKDFAALGLLYPKSNLLPVARAAMGNFYLEAGQPEKALAIFEKARVDYPFHALQCVFILGVGESTFETGGLEEARRSFRLVEQKCQNPRLVSLSKFRQLDIGFLENKPNLESKYESLIKEQLHSFNLSHPSAFYHLGELKYRAKKYSSARYYFDLYQKNMGVGNDCLAYASKRRADMDLREHKSIREIVSGYLIAHEQAPDSDAGRYSYLQGILVDLPVVALVEKKRRLQIFDEEIDKLDNPDFRKRAYLEKGLALLELGEMSALKYLVRLEARTALGFKKGPVGVYIEQKLLDLLKKEAAESSAGNQDSSSKRVRQLKVVLKEIENAYDVWLQGSPSEKKAKDLYAEILISTYKIHPTENERDRRARLKEFDDLYSKWIMGTPSEGAGQKIYAEVQKSRLHEKLNANLIDGAADLIKEWWDHPRLSLKDTPDDVRLELGVVLAEALKDSKFPDALALEVKKRRIQFEKITPGDLTLIWLVIADKTQDEKERKAIIAAIGGIRESSTLDARIPIPIQDYLWLNLAQDLKSVQRNEDAELVLLKIKGQDAKTVADEERLKLYEATDSHEKAYDLAKEAYLGLNTDTPKEVRTKRLQELLSIVQEGKLWTKSDELLGFAEKEKLEGKELAPYYYLRGRASFNLNEYENSVGVLEKAIALDPSAKDAAEAYYKLGKSLAKLEKKGQAKKVWEDLIKLGDEFWSSMAKNEMSIMENKK